MRTRTTLGLLATSIVGAASACSSASSNPGEPASSEVTRQTASAVTAPAANTPGKNDGKTKSPIKHVIVIIGENRSFDHVFGTYKPKDGQRIDNILAKKIVKEDGSPGENFALAIQKSAVDSPPSTFALSPPEQTPYAVLPPVLAGGAKTPYVSSLAQATTDESLALPRRLRSEAPHGRHGPDERHARHAPRAEPARRFRLGRSSSRRASRKTTTPRARFTASTRCGSSSTAASITRPSGTPPGASPTSSPGSRSPSARAPAARRIPSRHRRHHPRRLGVDGLLQHREGRRARTSRSSRTSTRSATTSTSRSRVARWPNHITLGTGDSDWYTRQQGQRG